METMVNRIQRSAFLVMTMIAVSASASYANAQQNRGGPNPRRQMLEQRLRQRTGEMVQKRLQLSDQQMKQLQASNSQFERQRSDLIARERETRRSLRAQMLAEKPDQNRVGQLLDQSMQLERQRLDLVQSEQR